MKAPTESGIQIMASYFTHALGIEKKYFIHAVRFIHEI